MLADLTRVIAELQPLDDIEREHQEDALAWIGSGSPIYRIEKPATPPKHLVAYCVLVDPTRKTLLLVDHRDAGLWLATGGHVDVDEDPADAARRELYEELGVSPLFLSSAGRRPLFIAQTVTGGVSAGHTDVSLWYVFEASEDDELRPDPGEFNDVRWWALDTIRHGPNTRFGLELPRFVNKLKQHSEVP